MATSIVDTLWRTWLYATQAKSLAVGLGGAFAILAVVLLFATRTRWGQAKPLTKCIALSVLAHVWLLMYALGSRAILPQGDPHGREQKLSVAFEGDLSHLSESATTLSALNNQAMGNLPDEVDGNRQMMPWEFTPLADLPRPALLNELLASETLSVPALLPSPELTPLPPLPQDAVEQLDEPENEVRDARDIASTDLLEVFSQSLVASAAQTSETQSEMAPETEPALQDVFPPPMPPAEYSPTQLATLSGSDQTEHSQHSDSDFRTVTAEHSPVLPPVQNVSTLPETASQLPVEYQLRQAPNRLQLTEAFGADADSEAAVQAGLIWLANAQSRDGSWNAKQFGGGTETNALGESRFGTGAEADTGVSGLALLAFLAAGNTHLHGHHKLVVQHGLEYLLRVQFPSGDLSGPKQIGNDSGVLYARMYCHSIAALAIAEAYAMTRDEVLQSALLLAAQYSINSQDIRGGGWRYRPLDSGDLSQFGWQAMVLKSVERSGTEVPVEVKRRMRRFLDSCSAGPNGGLATYRPKEGRPSETMTSESFACRLLLDYPTSLPAQNEAIEMIMNNRPGVGEDNVYFWYYATLALFQLQDENWREWNQSMKARLLATQVPVYSVDAGSWNPDRLWGGYGGRVYSTAMSCLCLEVYYRYLPLYQRTNLANASNAEQLGR